MFQADGRYRNFDGAGRVGVQAMNFAVGFMYSGQGADEGAGQRYC